MVEHWFWWLLTAACLVWYSTVTVYVAIRGVSDIRGMLRRLAAAAAHAEGKEVPPDSPR